MQNLVRKPGGKSPYGNQVVDSRIILKYFKEI
jgi:hypothetical protein